MEFNIQGIVEKKDYIVVSMSQYNKGRSYTCGYAVMITIITSVAFNMSDASNSRQDNHNKMIFFFQSAQAAKNNPLKPNSIPTKG